MNNLQRTLWALLYLVVPRAWCRFPNYIEEERVQTQSDAAYASMWGNAQSLFYRNALYVITVAFVALKFEMFANMAGYTIVPRPWQIISIICFAYGTLVRFEVPRGTFGGCTYAENTIRNTYLVMYHLGIFTGIIGTASA